MQITKLENDDQRPSTLESLDSMDTKSNDRESAVGRTFLHCKTSDELRQQLRSMIQRQDAQKKQQLKVRTMAYREILKVTNRKPTDSSNHHTPSPSPKPLSPRCRSGSITIATQTDTDMMEMDSMDVEMIADIITNMKREELPGIDCIEDIDETELTELTDKSMLLPKGPPAATPKQKEHTDPPRIDTVRNGDDFGALNHIIQRRKRRSSINLALDSPLSPALCLQELAEHQSPKTPRSKVDSLKAEIKKLKKQLQTMVDYDPDQDLNLIALKVCTKKQLIRTVAAERRKREMYQDKLTKLRISAERKRQSMQKQVDCLTEKCAILELEVTEPKEELMELRETNRRLKERVGQQGRRVAHLRLARYAVKGKVEKTVKRLKQIVDEGMKNHVARQVDLRRVLRGERGRLQRREIAKYAEYWTELINEVLHSADELVLIEREANKGMTVSGDQSGMRSKSVKSTGNNTHFSTQTILTENSSVIDTTVDTDDFEEIVWRSS